MRTRPFQFALILLASAGLLSSQETPPAPAAEATAPAASEKPAEPAVTIQGTEPTGAGVSRTHDTLSVDFPDEDIRTILRNVADLFELNLVIPDTLQGKTSIKLRDVTWRQIFEVILTPVGYTYLEQGSIIKIVSLESLAQEPVNTEVFMLNYARAGDIQPVVSTLVDSAAGGKLVVDARSNSLIITERPSKMKKIRPIVEQLDKATDQVMIESKFVEVSNTDVKNIGVNWSSLSGWGLSAGSLGRTYTATQGRTDTNQHTGANIDVPYMQNGYERADQLTARNGGDPVPSATTGLGPTFTLDPTTGLRTYSTIGPATQLTQLLTNNVDRVTTAVFDAATFNVVLSALKTLNQTKIVSNPTIVTLNNTEAFINVGSEFPVPNYTYNQERGSFEVSGFTYKPIGIILKVTPQVNARGFIKLSLEPEVSQQNGTTTFGGAGGAAIPIIATRKAKTQVSMKDGYTMAIGGLLRTQITNGGTKVPVLGSIPVLGRLFSSSTKNEDSTNLIIFITAKAINAEGASVEETVNSQQVRDLDMRRNDLPGYRDGSDPFVQPAAPEVKK
jgi:type IV pilus secretin PilQ/predicted competence protein